MAHLNIDAIRAEVRALDYVRGTPEEAAMWREDDADSRVNLAIEECRWKPANTCWGRFRLRAK